MRYWQSCCFTGRIRSRKVSLKLAASTAKGQRSSSGSSLSRWMMVE
jgi:hypothetical protein